MRINDGICHLPTASLEVYYLSVTFFHQVVSKSDNKSKNFRIQAYFMNPHLTVLSNRAAKLLACAIPLSFFSCESALSDMEITDPSVLQTHFVVERAVLDDGTVHHSLHANIFDKNLASVELKNGQVKVNGEQMTVAEILNISTYHIPGATVNLNTNYQFEVVLANGESYAGIVTTQAKTFTEVIVPTTSTVNSDLTISWQDVYIHDALTISVGLTTPSGAVAGPTFTLTDAEMQAGSFVIPKSAFATPAGATSATITIAGAEYGTIDSNFRSGSATISRMRVEKKVTFN